jgi:hypothetical protein
VEYAAFAWTLLFAAAHVYWAFGATFLLGVTVDLSAGVLFGFMAVILASTRESACGRFARKRAKIASKPQGPDPERSSL